MTPTLPPPPDDFDASPEEISRRLTWARRAGHPRYVWEDVSMSDWAAAVRAVERTTVAMLETGSALGGPEELSGAPGGSPETRALGVASFTTGMGPLLGAWCEAGHLRAPEPLAHHLRAQLAHGRARAVRVRALLEHVGELVGPAELRPVLLKGAHTAWSAFPEPGTRPAADVDLFVPRDRAPALEQLLESAGFVLERRQRRPTRSVWAPPGEGGALRSLELTHEWNPLTVDLHHSLERDFYGARRVRVPDPVEHELEPVPGLPDAFRGLSGPWLLAYLALHASEDLSNLQLLKLVELIFVGRAGPDPEALWASAASTAGGWGALGDVFPAWALAGRLVSGEVPELALREARSHAPQAIRELVDRLTPAGAQRLHEVHLVERMAGASTARARVRRLLHMLAPDSAGGSLRELARLYASRLYRVVRGRVRFRSRGEGPDE